MPLYVEALIKEMQCVSKRIQEPRPVPSIFLGGGTPTTLPAHLLADILQACRDCFQLNDDCEISLEANPATVNIDHFSEIRESGYNRISIGVQSFDADDLKALDRIHSIDEIHATVETARQAGFDNLSIDLMFALPGQTLDSWRKNINKALDLKTDHLSAYNLTIEKGTAFDALYKRGALTLPQEEDQLELYKEAIRSFTNAGFSHYEISNYARQGKECRHNLLYWHNEDTLGFGAGAAMYFEGVRSKNVNPPAHYIRRIQENGSAVESSERLEREHAMSETLMLGLRLLQGLDLERFENKFQTSFFDVYGETVDKLFANQLLQRNGARLALTSKGLYLADSVILEFFS